MIFFFFLLYYIINSMLLILSSEEYFQSFSGDKIDYTEQDPFCLTIPSLTAICMF